MSIVSAQCIKRNPAFQDTQNGLDFGMDLGLSDKDRAARFVANFNSVICPFVTKNDTEMHRIEVTLGIVKKSIYKRFVIEEGWSERKLVFVLDYILDLNINVTYSVVRKIGIMYDNETLPLQLEYRQVKGSEKASKGKRERI